MKNGKILRTFQPEVLRRVLSPSTCREMSVILRHAVEEGTGKGARLDHFTVAGKTGTAQKIDPLTGSYHRDHHVASFLGFFPAEYPMFTILVMIDEPQGEGYGGVVAAPVFREIAGRISRYVKLPAQNTEVYEFDWREFQPAPAPHRTGPVLMAKHREDRFETYNWEGKRNPSNQGDWLRRVFHLLFQKAQSLTQNEYGQETALQ
jgi:membrane peptidoglycan carboxypeptidase